MIKEIQTKLLSMGIFVFTLMLNKVIIPTTSKLFSMDNLCIYFDAKYSYITNHIVTTPHGQLLLRVRGSAAWVPRETFRETFHLG